MRLGRFSARLGALLVPAVLLLPGTATATDYYTLATIAPGTTPYVVTTAFAQSATHYVPDVEMQVNATGSAARHMVDGAQGNVDFFMTSSILSYFMKSGSAMYSGIPNASALHDNLRGVFNFLSGAFQMVVFADSGMETLADIKGKTVFLGPPGGGAAAFATTLVEGATGYTAGEDFSLARMGFGAAQQAFQDRQIDVWVTPALVPGAAITQIALTNKIRILGLSGNDFQRSGVKEAMSLPGRSRERIPADAYGKNQVNTEAVYTGGAWVGVGVRKGLPEDVVYRITKAFWEHIDDLHQQGEGLKIINLNNALKHMGMPLHPGAIRYYREAGLTVPEALVPQG